MPRKTDSNTNPLPPRTRTPGRAKLPPTATGPVYDPAQAEEAARVEAEELAAETREVAKAGERGQVAERALTKRWQAAAFLTQRRLKEAAERGDHNAAKAWAVACGISTEKTLLLAGRPTSITADIYELRGRLPELAEKLARVRASVAASAPLSSSGEAVPRTQGGA